MCARFALSLSAIDSLQTHTCVCASAHILTHRDDDGKRGTPRKWVEERMREREGKKITSYINARDDCSAVCMNDIQQSGGKHIIAYRSVRLMTMMMSRGVVLLRSYGTLIFFLSFFLLPLLRLSLVPFICLFSNQ